MASYVLINNYLDIVGRHLEYRSDATDLHDELADHLIESTDRAIARGLDQDSAQRSTLDRFGDPHIVAATLAAVPTKGIDMVHAIGRSAGILSIISAVLWIAVVVGGPFGLIDYLDQSWSTGDYFITSLIQGLAVLVSGVALVGMNFRFSARADALTAVVAIIALLAWLTSFAVAWFFFGWGMLFGTALAVTIARLRGEAVVKGVVSALLLVIAPLYLLVGSIAGLLGLFGAEAPGNPTSAEVQQTDLALFLATLVLCLVLAAGYAVVGLRLRAAIPVQSMKDPAALA